MGRYIAQRLALAVPIVLAILIINFLIVHLVPGDPVQALVGDFPTPPGYT
jgi:peptide/nickel transport system permease protein